MSDALRRLYQYATGRHGEKSAHRAEESEPDDKRPLVIRDLEKLLSVRLGVDRPKIHRVRIGIETVFSENGDEIVCEQTPRLVFGGDATHLRLCSKSVEKSKRPLVLAIERVCYDTVAMPIDVQVELLGLEPQFTLATDIDAPVAPPAVDNAIGRGIRSSSLRDDLWSARQKREPGDSRKLLLCAATPYSEPAANACFCSIEAIGFDSLFFFEHIVQRVPDEIAERLPRLFWSKGVAYSPTSSAKTLHHGAGQSAFYWVPLLYKYTTLLLNVRAYLVAQKLYANGDDIDRHPLSRAVDDLPQGESKVLFEYTDLHAVTTFIDEQLIGIHPRFCINDFRVDIVPLAYDTWAAAMEARTAHGSLSRVLTAYDSASTDANANRQTGSMRCDGEFDVYYIFSDNAHEPPDLLETSIVVQSEDTTEASYEDDDDDDASLSFKTPRSVYTTHNTPRPPPTLASFLSMAVVTGNNGASDGNVESSTPSPPLGAYSSETLTDNDAPIIGGPLMQTPRRIILSGKALPTHLISVDESDDRSSERSNQSLVDDESSVRSSSQSNPAVSSSSIGESSEQRFAAAQIVLRKANRRLRTMTNGTTYSDDDNNNSSLGSPEKDKK